MLRILTTTGARPEAWGLCKEFMISQDYPGKVHWIIVDDGPQPENISFRKRGWRVEVVRPEPFWELGRNTQIRNLKVGADLLRASFEKFGNGPVSIIEDDDYYAPDYLSKMLEALEGYEMVGELNPKYFNCLFSTGKKFKTPNHTSLASTLVQGSGVEALYKAIERGRKFVDIDLWYAFVGKKRLVETGTHMGIKQMPGRGGIGQGHQINFGHPVDPKLWLGAAYRFYKDFIFDEGANMKVKALVQHPYRGKYRTVGSEYEITNPADLKILLAMKKVQIVNPPPEKKVAKPRSIPAKAPAAGKGKAQAKSEASEKPADEPAKDSKTYSRRDMRAE